MTASIRWCVSSRRFRVIVRSGAGPARYQVWHGFAATDLAAIAECRAAGVLLTSITVEPAEP